MNQKQKASNLIKGDWTNKYLRNVAIVFVFFGPQIDKINGDTKQMHRGCFQMFGLLSVAAKRIISQRYMEKNVKKCTQT
jgi:hypothetical protein